MKTTLAKILVMFEYFQKRGKKVDRIRTTESSSGKFFCFVEFFIILMIGCITQRCATDSGNDYI